MTFSPSLKYIIDVFEICFHKIDKIYQMSYNDESPKKILA